METAVQREDRGKEERPVMDIFFIRGIMIY